MTELIALKKSYGELFLPSEEYLWIIAQCCKEPHENIPAVAGIKCPILESEIKYVLTGLLD